MSVTDLVIDERIRDIGDFLVGRFLPFRKKRMVGPFIFMDHMGPSEVGQGKYLDVNQHPHIGLSTVTYLLEGTILHCDSLGSVQEISPGSVNWMTAGIGVTHTERTPEQLRSSRFMMDGYQVWVALPKEHEDAKPSFHHFPAEALPAWKQDEAEFRLIVGEAFGKKSPVPVHSHMFLVEIKNTTALELDLKDQVSGEIGILIHSGCLQACENKVKKGQMLISKEKNVCQVILDEGSHIFIFGGQSLPEERFIHWNFVSSSKDKIEKARQMWIDKQFPKVPGDDTYVPLPNL